MLIEKYHTSKVPERYIYHCQASVLKISDGYVTGNRWNVLVPWEELQEELQTFLELEEIPSWDWGQLIPSSFSVTYKKFNYGNAFFIQGLVLESHLEYAKKMQLIVDLKGNFPKETTTFFAWGKSEWWSPENVDDLRLYNNQDTLFMFLYPAYYNTTYGMKTGDYITLPMSHSVVKLSNDSVSGYIISCWKEKTMPWEDFQTLTELNLNKETQ